MAPRNSPMPSWMDVPRKGELAVIFSVRLVDFFQQAALQAVLYAQIQSFDPEAAEEQISFQAGLLQGAFSLAQVPSSILWGRVADSRGRKFIILTSLVGQAISCLGVAFSRDITAAIVWRALGGVVNATVGGARVALSEKTEKKYHSKTFTLLPLAFSLSNVIGPPIAGALSDPAQYYPNLYGKTTWLRKWPYAPPNIFCAVLLLADALLVFLCLQETLLSRQGRRDRGLELAEGIKRFFATRIFRETGYTRVRQEAEVELDVDDHDTEANHPMIELDKREEPMATQAPLANKVVASRTRVFTRNVCLVLLTVAGLDFQLAGFTALWSIFLASEKASPSSRNATQRPFYFEGGLGFSPAVVGMALSILGWAGVFTQLAFYPRVNARFGLLKPTIYSLFLIPLPYALAPWLSRLSSSSQFLLWFGILFIGSIVMVARTFAIPGIVLLTNNAAPSPEVLGSIHGLGAAVSSAFKTIGPVVAGKWYSTGLQNKEVGLGWPWWWLSATALFGAIPILFVRDGG